MAKKVIKAEILSNRQIAPNYFVMDIKAPWLGQNSHPGQFVNIRVQEDVTDPLLRIPLGVHRMGLNGISLLYKVVGQGTKLLSQRKKGEIVDILGPLGSGFDFSQAARKKDSAAILVAGGQGIAPLCGLALTIIAKKRKVDFFIGTGTKDHVLCARELEKLGVKVHVATDDGTMGYRGNVTDLVTKHLKNLISASGSGKPGAGRTRRGIFIFACGPKVMLATLAKDAKKFRIPLQVTYDEYMACGIGACRGCAVETTEGIKLACEDGPVFDAGIIKWR